VTIVVCTPPSVTTTSLPSGAKGQPYNQTITASGGKDAGNFCNSSSFTFTQTAGTLPPGLTLASNGTISGTPTQSGTYGFTVQATDETGHTATRSLSITVAPNVTLFVANTDVVSAGIGGMRKNGAGVFATGTGEGTLVLAGVSGSVTKALLYWNGPTNSVNPNINASVTFNENPVTGVNIGSASSNLWSVIGATHSYSYRADVTSFVTGDGYYSLTNFTKSAGSEFADINGVSLIVFFNDGNSLNNSDVYLTDGNDSNVSSPFEPADWNTALTSVNNTTGFPQLELHVSDGQAALDGALSLNGTQFEPQGEIFAGTSVPQSTTGAFPAWDIRTFGVSGALLPGVHDATLTAPFISDALSVVVMMIKIPLFVAF
jgi:hypothetical protein